MEKINAILDKSVPSSEEEHATWEQMKEHDLRARNYIIASMTNELQCQHKHMTDATSCQDPMIPKAISVIIIIVSLHTFIILYSRLLRIVVPFS